MKDYRELDVWIESRRLNKLVYQVSNDFPKEEVFGLTSQLRRSSVSVASNIAEGCGRSSDADIKRFLMIARGSLFETETQLFLALDLNYLSEGQFESLQVQILSCKKLLNGFIGYFRKKQSTNN